MTSLKKLPNGGRVSRQVQRIRTPEEDELASKLQELSSLEGRLAQGELDLATLGGVLESLEIRYRRIVGTKYLELDTINAAIAEILAARQPSDEQARADARQAYARAEQTAKETEDAALSRKVEAFSPTPRLRELYRSLAKMIHPDLAVDKRDQGRRTWVMAEVNRAYREGDVNRLEAILTEWQSSPDAIEGEDVPSRLVRTIRMIARVRTRLAQIELEMQAMVESDLHALRQKCLDAAEAGKDLLQEMADKVGAEIRAAKASLESLGVTDPRERADIE